MADQDTTLLAGRVAVVTGSTRGLGRAYAEALAATGARVVVNGTDATRVEQTVAAIAAAGGEAVGVTAGVETNAGARRLIGTAVGLPLKGLCPWRNALGTRARL